MCFRKEISAPIKGEFTATGLESQDHLSQNTFREAATLPSVCYIPPKDFHMSNPSTFKDCCREPSKTQVCQTTITGPKSPPKNIRTNRLVQLIHRLLTRNIQKRLHFRKFTGIDKIQQGNRWIHGTSEGWWRGGWRWGRGRGWPFRYVHRWRSWRFGWSFCECLRGAVVWWGQWK